MWRLVDVEDGLVESVGEDVVRACECRRVDILDALEDCVGSCRYSGSANCERSQVLAVGGEG